MCIFTVFDPTESCWACGYPTEKIVMQNFGAGSAPIWVLSGETTYFKGPCQALVEFGTKQHHVKLVGVICKRVRLVGLSLPMLQQAKWPDRTKQHHYSLQPAGTNIKTATCLCGMLIPRWVSSISSSQRQ
ncbi:TPA: hypothetical protein ACH3X2_005366 [Trebouxia sp. C0005]